ncbi:MarR family transcriptional regulator [Nitratireductor mangrovi]|uniref:MarR family transcriptional regulator n=1 Tax=Nitratireductor mangrovi TaxID=2599600 RepID=A0A5B8L2L2_9HYPH|nr:MarR family transcriptional regulator [Nitratireductor mangrovi]QDZ02191.1 MarR family transcriptional regulator [Nitratireductor mangrovi]
MTDLCDIPGHLVRRLQQAAVAIFLAEVGEAGFDLTPVQFAALSTVISNPGVDQATLAGLIAYDRTTIGGVVDRLVKKGYVARTISRKDRRARELRATEDGHKVFAQMEPAVMRAQKIMLRGLEAGESDEFLRLLRKALAAVNDRSRAPLRMAPALSVEGE